MKRRLFNLVAALSLLLCLATIALCVRGQFVEEELIVRRWNSYIAVIHRTCLKLSVNGATESTGVPVITSSDWEVEHYRYPAEDFVPKSRFLGLSWYSRKWWTDADTPQRQLTARTLFVPWWMLVVATLILPLALLTRRLRSAKITQAGAVPCQNCGYDLRATPERCPECGTAAAKVMA